MQRVNINRGNKHHKPTKGQKMHMQQKYKAQNRRKALKEARTGMEQITDAMKARWRKLSNWYWKTRFLTGKYTPHQGNKEKARRVRQMAEHKCINPEAWV